MFFIVGVKRHVEVLGVVTLVCSHCGHPAAQRVETWRNKLTLFFVPLLTVSTKHVIQCAYCAASSRVDDEQARRLVASGDRAAG